MRNAGSSEAAYAGTALLLGLLDVLASKGILTRSDLNTIMVDAISKLEPTPTNGSIGGAGDLIRSLLPQIHGSSDDGQPSR
jgi:hypothetical protein